MKKLTTLLLIASALNAYTQDWPVKNWVMQKKTDGTVFEKLSAFSLIANKKLSGLQSFQQLLLAPGFKKTIIERKPEVIQISLPIERDKSINLLLARFGMGLPKITENNSTVLENIQLPVTYRGIVQGESKRNNAMLTVSEENISLLVLMSDKMLQVTKEGETGNQYRLYNSSKLTLPPFNLNCGTIEKNIPSSSTEIDLSGGTSPTAVGDKCINVFVDCFDSLYINQSSNRQRTVSFVYELFNGVATAFYNDSINIQITSINVWTTTDPYTGMTRETLLRQLADYYQDNFWGNICVGLDYNTRSLSGLADDIGRIKATSANTCPAYGADVSACCYNDLQYTVATQGFPAGLNTTQSQMYLVTHEIGHLLGSRHTKWCGWQLTQNPPSFGRIDSCDVSEPPGGCMQGPAPPGGAATIMSYCTTAPNFISFNNGFGILPGRAIRNFVESSTCVLNCSDCFGQRLQTNSAGSSYAGAGNGHKQSKGNSLQQPHHRSHIYIPPKNAKR